jgi:hypothetical protein
METVFIERQAPQNGPGQPVTPRPVEKLSSISFSKGNIVVD